MKKRNLVFALFGFIAASLAQAADPAPLSVLNNTGQVQFESVRLVEKQGQINGVSTDTFQVVAQFKYNYICGGAPAALVVDTSNRNNGRELSYTVRAAYTPVPRGAITCMGIAFRTDTIIIDTLYSRPNRVTVNGQAVNE